MAREFNGSDEYLLRTAAVVGSFPLSMACRFKLDSAAGEYALTSLWDSATASFASLRADGDSPGDPLFGSLYDQVADEDVLATTSSGYTANAWHHGAAVFPDVANSAVYIDGGSKGTGNNAASTSVPLDRTSIGYLTPGFEKYCDGSIAWAAYWSLALSDAQVASLAAGYSPLQIAPQALVAFYPLGGLHIANDKDIVGGLDLTAQNAPTWDDHPPGLIYPSGPRVMVPTAAVGLSIPIAMHHYTKNITAA